jgi:hypothetical protein
MPKFRCSISSLLLVTMLVALSLLPINRNTAKQIWFSIDTKNAPTGGMFISGGGTKHQIPYNYGDTWFSRFHQLKSVMISAPQSPMAVVKPIIILEEEETLFLHGAEETNE